jgi:hypothetical protein
MTINKVRVLSMALLLFVCFTSCGKADEVAIIPIRVGAETIYIKRQVWGLNGDETVISRNPGWRTMPQPGDLRYCCLGPPILLYRVNGGSLHIWDQAKSWVTEPGAPSHVPLVIHESTVLALQELETNARANGMTLIGPHDWPLRRPMLWER